MLYWSKGPKTPFNDICHKKGFLLVLAPDEIETYPEVLASEKRQSATISLTRSYDDWHWVK